MLPSPAHDQLCITRTGKRASASDRCREDRDRESIAASPEFPSTPNFVGASRVGREERFQAIFGAVLFGGVGEEQDCRLMIAALPGMEKAIGSGKRGNVVFPQG